MNVWECDAPECKLKVVGCGSAIGLRAIGWWWHPRGLYERGPNIRCPEHRPDPIPCVDKYTDEDKRRESCAHCKANQEAARWQIAMGLPDYERIGYEPD